MQFSFQRKNQRSFMDSFGDPFVDDELSDNNEKSQFCVEKDEIEKKELQQQHYVLLGELQDLARQLPAKYQQRLPYDLLSGLASSLLDGTVFQIVRGLSEIQQMTERNLFHQRQNLVNTYKANKSEMAKKQKEALQMAVMNRPHNVPLLEATHAREAKALDDKFNTDINRMDMKLIMELDQKVSDQQVTLEKAGVPGFHVTNNAQEVRLQMYLLDFIIQLGNQRTEAS